MIFVEWYCNLQQSVAELFRSSGGLVLYFGLLIILRLACLVVKSTLRPYSSIPHTARCCRAPKLPLRRGTPSPYPTLFILKKREYF